MTEPPPVDISDFAVWYDQFQESKRIEIARYLEYGAARQKSGSIEILWLFKELNEMPGWKAGSSLDIVDLTLQKSSSDTFEFMGQVLDGWPEFHFEVSSATVYIDKASFPRLLGVPQGPFRQVFGDLQAYADSTGVQSLPKLEELLTENNWFESVVIHAAVLGSMLVLLSLQLYFLIYTKQLKLRLKPEQPGWNVLWIGIDLTNLGKYFFFITIAIFPAFSLIFVLWRTSQ